jgi:membrane protein implicated in regulation of membrane protease activity
MNTRRLRAVKPGAACHRADSRAQEDLHVWCSPNRRRHGCAARERALAGHHPGRGEVMPAWLVWMIVAAVLSVVELLTLTVAAGLLAVAAVTASVTAALGAGAAGQAAAFAVAGSVSMAVMLPAVRRHRRAGRPAPRTGVAALVGQSALVIEPVNAHHGRVRINGEVWSARAFTPGQVIPAGAVVDVFEIDGATALVYAEERS